MSFDLFNESTAISRRLSRQSWAKTLQLARLYGWKPRGTRPPPHHDFHKLNADWHERYLTNDGQVVVREDALALAAALEVSLNDITNDPIRFDWNPEFWTDEDDLPEWLSPEERAMIEECIEGELLDVMDIDPLEFFAGAEKDDLARFIRFCRLGSFIIM